MKTHLLYSAVLYVDFLLRRLARLSRTLHGDYDNESHNGTIRKDFASFYQPPAT